MDGAPSVPDPNLSAEEIFLELADLAAEERASRLSGIPGPVRQKVESMLDSLDAGAWLEEPLCDPRWSPAGAIGGELERIGEDPESLPPRRIGRYQIRRTLGSGGHAVVYLALETGDLQRWVALKVLRDTRASTVARFDAERRALASLEHRGIPRIFESGREPGGSPWFAMELVRGDWITRWCRERTLPVRERVELFREALDAVRSAHAAGIVHRDLKPANVMVGEHGGRPQVKVIDFGIARGGKVGAAELATTDAPGLLGSLAAMSPEQVREGVDAATYRSDIYALGAMLFELLADRPPRTLRDRSLGDVVREIANREPPRLAMLAPQFRGDLDAIVGRAMSFEPDSRYASVTEFDADLARWLAGEPVLARVPSRIERCARWLRRHRRAAAVTVLVAAALATFGWIDRSRAARITAMREVGRLNSLLEEEFRLRRERGAESERRRLISEVLSATEAASRTPFEPAERAAIRARALLADCEPDLRSELDPASTSMRTEAVALCRLVVADRPVDPTALVALSMALVRLGDADPRKAERALSCYREAHEIDQRLHREHPSIRRFHDDLVWSHDRLAMTYWNLDQFERSRTEFAAMADEARRLVADHPDPAASHRTASHALRLVACIRAADGDLDAAGALLYEATRELDEAMRRDASDVLIHHRREPLYWRLASVELARGRVAEARMAGDRAEESAAALSVIDPGCGVHEPSIAIEARLRLAASALEAGNSAQAAQILDEADRIERERSVRLRGADRFPSAARIAIMRGDVSAIDPVLGRWRNEDPVAPKGSMYEPPHALGLAVRDLVHAAESIQRRDPVRVEACLEVARTIIGRAKVRFPGHAAVDEMQARLAQAEGRRDDAAASIDASLLFGQERLNPSIMLDRAVLRAAISPR